MRSRNFVRNKKMPQPFFVPVAARYLFLAQQEVNFLRVFGSQDLKTSGLKAFTFSRSRQKQMFFHLLAIFMDGVHRRPGKIMHDRQPATGW